MFFSDGSARSQVSEIKYAGRSKQAFEKIAGGDVLKLSLIGMSGAGKSYWAHKLAAAGFRAISIDDRIENKLAPELAAGAHRGIGGVAAWMGWPDQPSYRQREAKYLECEVESMDEALDEIQSAGAEGIVLDTTGSVVYTGERICRRLQNLTSIVYLEATATEEELLISRYLSDPKPVLWGDQFTERPNESAKQAVARCYPHLIEHRKNLYQKYAHRIVSMARLKEIKPDARGFLETSLEPSLESRARPAQ